jgi:hypothetical protein
LDNNNSEELKRKLYNFFFNWSKDGANDETKGGTTVNYDDLTSNGGRGTLSDD